MEDDLSYLSLSSQTNGDYFEEPHARWLSLQQEFIIKIQVGNFSQVFPVSSFEGFPKLGKVGFGMLG